MTKFRTADPAADIAAVIAWWRDAGVDHLYGDAPLALAAPEEKPRSEAAAPSPATPPAAPPASLRPPPEPDAFRAWWLAEPALDNGRVSGRLAPSGQTGAEVMVVVEQPEADDRDVLLSGPQGHLLDSILSAMGLDRARAYVASVIPRHMPLPDWPDLARQGLGEVLRHHVALVKPARLILFGGNILPLAGNHLPKSAHSSPRFNHEGGSVPVFVARDLPALLDSPRFKAGLWKDWLAWKRDLPVGQE